MSTKDLISIDKYELKENEFRWVCPETMFNFKSTADIKELEKIVGQERAIEAIRMGSELKAKGYNIFVTGLSGTGRTTTVKKIIDDNSISCPITYDYCYVNNFQNEDNPLLLRLPKSRAKIFATSMAEAVSFLSVRLPKLFEEESYQIARKKIIDQYQQKERENLNEFDKKIKPLGFIRGQLENEQGFVQPEVFPLIDGEAVALESLDDLVEAGKLTKKKSDELKKLWNGLHDEVFELSRISMKLIQEFRKELLTNDKLSADTVVTSAFQDIEQNFQNYGLDNYLLEVKQNILSNLNIFVPSQTPVPLLAETNNSNDNADYFNKFKVNVILDNSDTENVPVIIETTPTYNNIFGTIEKTYDQRGFWKSDFNRIKAGSILRADQGFLILNADDLYNEPGVWTALKRLLLHNKLEIQPYDSYFQISQTIIKPEPIDINVKVIIIGGQTLYKWLYANDKDFKKIFKVNAQFDYETIRTDEMLHNYAGFIAKICNEESLTHCSPSGVATVIEWAVEQSGSQNKLILKFSDVADLLREAHFYSKENNVALISREDVKTAIDWRRKRSDLIDEKLKNEIIDGVIMIDTEGSKVGIINGLTIYNNGVFAFGKPARISANVSVGTAGIINIEREADMSGKIHNKGVLIISGFIREKFAKQNALSLTASIAFEQNYGGIDGDSASAAEIYAILSAITEIPIKQSIAITGSVNQKGDIQPIGGVNEKITGFYEICKTRGLDGSHGCVIPSTNVKDLMLNQDIIDDCKSGLFHIWAISKIDEGVEILFGLESGVPDNLGKFKAGTLYAKASDKIDEFVEIIKPKKKISHKDTTIKHEK